VSRLWDLLASANRLQQAMPFKIAASALLVIAAIGLISAYAISITAPATPAATEASAPATAPSAAPGAAEPESDKAIRAAYEESRRMVQELLSQRSSPTNTVIGIAFLTGLALLVVWLGIGLTYLGLVGLAIGVALPLRFLGMPGTSQLLLGIIALTASFAALMQALRLAFSGSGPIPAIARTMLAEAVRMKVSLVLIVVLIFGLAALPLLQSGGDAAQPLRYRVQSFLQYGTGGSYWMIAVLTLAFAAASVAFEQRDKQIWQTMTKPVAPWQYILGKWLGAAGLSAVLLMVCFAGVFLFTEHLRKQPAMGETRELIARGEATEDRKILETQVLSARRSVRPATPLSRSDETFRNWVKSYIEEARVGDPTFATTDAVFEKVESDLYKSYEQVYRRIPSGEFRAYVFNGLRGARAGHGPLTVRYKLDAGGNNPSDVYRITFLANGVLIQPPSEVSLGVALTRELPATLVDETGRLELVIYNESVEQGPDGNAVVTRVNPEAISFAADGLEVFYSAGSYQANFARVALVLWVKLAFLAMLGITAATFLSFPVACLVAFSVFLIAESTGYLTLSLEYYDAADQLGNIQWWKIPVRAIGLAVTAMFKTYSDLRPTSRLVDGRLLDLSTVVWGMTVLAAWSLALYAVGVGVFRRRELATYSGH
jgi:ABC-type transport system involved in multi-copper enzyme maturation permease subunit